LLLLAWPWMSASALVTTTLAGVFAFAPRLIAVRAFQQPLGSALLHPLGVLALLAIQWQALARSSLGKTAEWKGRRYAMGPGIPSTNVT
jgi:hypothetical protein